MKNSKSQLIDLIEFLQKQTGKTQGALSEGAGYASETLAQVKAKKSGHQAVIDQLKIVYKDILKKSIYHEIESENNKTGEEGPGWGDKSPPENLTDKNFQMEFLKKENEYLKRINELQQQLIDTEKKKDTPKNMKSPAA